MLRKTSAYMLAHGISALLGFASVVLFTRLLSPAEYGVYVVGMSFAGIISALLFAWIRLSILRFESEGGEADIRLTALMGYGVSVASAPIALLIAVYWTGEPLERSLLAILLALTLGMFEFGQEVLRARQKSLAYMLAAVSRAAMTLVFSLVFVSLGLGGISLILGISGAYALTALLFAPQVWSKPLRRFDPATFRQMLIFGVPMALSGGMAALHAALDRLIVVYYLGESATGVYGASADLVRQIVLFPAIAVASAIVPMAIRALTEGGKAAADAHLVKSSELLLAVLMPTVVGLAIVAPNLSHFILGPEFAASAATLIPILVFAWLFQAISQQFVQVSFHLAKKPGLLVVHSAGILIVNVSAMVLLVPRFELVGAGWALVIAEAFGVAFGYLVSLWAHPLPISLAPILRVGLAAAAMAIPAWLFQLWGPGQNLASLALSVVSGIVVYVAAAIALDLVGVRTALQRFRRAGLTVETA